MDLSYGLYMAEQSGLLNTRESAIHAIIKATREYPSETIDGDTFQSICEDNGIDADSLSHSEYQRILNAIQD